jgi:opacity protein-like surface antigen
MRTAIVFVLAFVWAGHAEAQPSRSERGDLFVSLASAHIFRAEDRTFGDRPDIGGGVRLPLTHRIGLQFEVNRPLGLHADAARCGLAAGCIGTAREGLLEATLATANVYVRFPHGRAEPYLIAGAGGLWTTGVNSLTVVRDGVGVMSEFESRDAGLAIGGGAGVDFALTRRLSVRPEFRIYDSSAMSRMNLTVFRSSVAVGWRW